MKKILLDHNINVGDLLDADFMDRMDYRVQLLIPDNDYSRTHYILTCLFNGVQMYTNIPIDLDRMMIDVNFTGIKLILYTEQQLSVYDEIMNYLAYMGIVAMSMDIPVHIQEPRPLPIGTRQ